MAGIEKVMAACACVVAMSAISACAADAGDAGAVETATQPVGNPRPTPTPSPTATTTISISPALPPVLPARTGYYFGADLSYVNSLEAPGCDAKYRVNDVVTDPFRIYRDYGANLVRVRLFVDPAVNTHSDLADATRAIARAKAQGMQVLLDFHYSDTFADPERQQIPAAWAALTGQALVDRLYGYTRTVLDGLNGQNLMPELVQIGNETNSNILRTPGMQGFPLDWARNAALFNAGIRAVRDAGAVSTVRPKVLLHIAQPENVDWWFSEAVANGVTGFDMIGFSYYPAYSDKSIQQTGDLVKQWKAKFGKDVLMVETAYPFTFEWADAANNLMYTTALEGNFPATPEGQRDYMIAITQSVIGNGGKGAIAWEPAWIAAGCRFTFGVGSPWENVTNFDWRVRNNAHAGISWLGHNYAIP